jgi:protein translocase SecG subunit
MEILKIVLTILFVIDGIALTIIVLLQEGKSAGLGSIAGGAETYWGQQGTFYGRCTCQIYEVLSMFIYDTGSSFESRCI